MITPVKQKHHKGFVFTKVLESCVNFFKLLEFKKKEKLTKLYKPQNLRIFMR